MGGFDFDHTLKCKKKIGMPGSSLCDSISIALFPNLWLFMSILLILKLIIEIHVLEAKEIIP